MMRSGCVSAMWVLLVGCGLPAPGETELPALGQTQQGLPCSAPCPYSVIAKRGQNGLQIPCYCSPIAVAQGGAWGTGIYTDDSILCWAARHAGAVTSAGGDIVATIAPGLTGPNSYTGSTQNGVTTLSYGTWGGSVTIASGPACTLPIPQCPGSVTSYRGQNGIQVTCNCTSSATASGTVWGTSIYTDDSALCRAAVHAGAITLSGGEIHAIIRPGQSSYVGSTQNGVTSYSYGAWLGSVEFAVP
jgi:hypothetical protein